MLWPMLWPGRVCTFGERTFGIKTWCQKMCSISTLVNLQFRLNWSCCLSKMPRTVEIKARVRDLDEVRRLASELSQSGGDVIQQRDIFFNSNSGRLKLRHADNNQDSQLFFYSRKDEKGPKISDYSITRLDRLKTGRLDK